MLGGFVHECGERRGITAADTDPELCEEGRAAEARKGCGKKGRKGEGAPGGQPQASSRNPPEGKCVLCALENSLPSTRALQFVLEKLVRAEQGDKLVLFEAAKAVDHHDDPATAFKSDPELCLQQEHLERQCRSYLENLREGLGKASGRPRQLITTEVVVQKGDPRQLIPDYVAEHEVDMVVVGARGLGKYKSLILGSVSAHLVRPCPVPVLVVPSNPKNQKDRRPDASKPPTSDT
ncbi:universal stress protein family protein [Klebsormidium nitens]|uniref:Universal stress protein family protein n=1 Tax=Klebsormidium nitens TaxID=105231 RepID=A0A1Y1HNP9_KLENI|nr:universal stress protein family protein [Klebsormidium nitens]|eukprot:GAQ78611.1 universal stress protein family protein [Klebsormidium nitens]